MYGYGIDAIRNPGRGGHSIAVVMQLDLERPRTGAPGSGYGPDRSSFFHRFMRTF